jgi:hypothetical integral membrane protein (TIGR02206 family)
VEQLSLEHLVALGLTAAVAVAAALAAHSRPGGWEPRLARALAALLGLNLVAYHAVRIARDSWSVDFDLPLHLTDVVAIVAVLALWTPRPLTFELTYYWGLTAALLAILTPDLGQAFPSFFFFNYFISHSGVVVAAAFLAAGIGLVPRAGAVRRVFRWTAAVAVIAALANLATGGNYMFLDERPDEPTPLDLMGPWPWYIGSAAVVALGLFALLDLPFRGRERRFVRAW